MYSQPIINTFTVPGTTKHPLLTVVTLRNGQPVPDVRGRFLFHHVDLTGRTHLAARGTILVVGSRFRLDSGSRVALLPAALGVPEVADPAVAHVERPFLVLDVAPHPNADDPASPHYAALLEFLPAANEGPTS